MRVIGKRREPPPGLRWPSEDEVARTREFARGTLLRHPKGVKRYHNHEEADAHMRSLIADEMARRYQELLDKKR